MALDEQMADKEAPKKEGLLTDEEEDDLQIALMLAEQLIDEGGHEVLKTAEESKDPGQVIGQFLMQMVSQMNEKLPPDVQLSKRIYFAKDGWIEQISDYIQAQYGVDKKTMDRAEIFIGTAARKMAQGVAAQEQGAAPMGAEAAAPAAAPPQGPGPVMPMGGA